MSLVNRAFGPLFKRMVARAVLSEEVQDALRPFAERRAIAPPHEITELNNAPSPYESAYREKNTTARSDVVFVTSRFRSGSTALWSAFRQLSDVTAYYEPFNERRFFDPVTRGSGVDATHIGIDDYWTEYDSTHGLADLYDENWIRHRLFMGQHAWNPKMQRFIDLLIEQSEGRPVLQFNRVDFRLPWLSQHYPEASIVHLYRNPREQWCSFLINIHEFPRDINPDQFVYRFYLDRWARDLQHVMPILERETLEHPYQLFYLVWKLSYLFGERYATHSLSFEQLTSEPIKTLSMLAKILGMGSGDAERMSSAITQPRPERWSEYADSSWFEMHERYCEDLLDSFLGAAGDHHLRDVEKIKQSRTQ